MKKLIVLVWLGLYPFVALAQRGVYLSANDFYVSRISYTGYNHITLNDGFYKPFIKITREDSIFQFNKDSIFGYRDKNNNSYRFFNKRIYIVLNPGEEILLYSYEKLGGYKNAESIIQYFFSKNASSRIQPLTIGNVKNAFKSNAAFVELLDIYFHSDNELLKYDGFHHLYKLNDVFNIANNKQSLKLNN